MKKTLFITTLKALLIFALLPGAVAQQPSNVLDQNISLYVENEPLESVIEKICEQFNLDYDYNSKLIKGKRINLSISNKSVREVLDKLMEDYFLIFEIENNLLVVRDYVPMSKSIDFKEMYSKSNTGFLFDNTKTKTKIIDFKLISNLIIIPISINNSDTMNFILDTGVKEPIITELTLVEELDLNYLHPVKINGLGSENDIQAYQSGDNTITLPGLTARHVKLNVILDESFQISQILGMPVHGLVGFDLFRHYIVEIDYQREKIELTKPQFFKYKPRRNDIVLPIKMVRNKPIIQSEIVQDNGEIVPVKLLVDTGASDALWLITETDSSIVLPEKNLFTYLGAGLGGDLYGHKGRLSSLWLGGKPISSPIASYPQSHFINQIIKSEKRNGTLGGEILRRFTVTIDYYNNRLILDPNSNFKNKFNYNMSGLEVINPVPGVPVFTVSNVIEESPAWEAGVRENDQILRINFMNHNSLTLNDINLELRQKDNKKIRLTLLRNGEEFKTEFRLKEII
ncbi:MAG: aspartyl protease family protein [Prolixibacteraceae bacterium]|nr:aspartyl protease family protein [Prolixibacteraceae bacterium]